MFDEQIFIKALTVRPEDAKRFSASFKPEWLGDARIQMILEEMFSFIKELKVPPNLKTLRKVLEDKDHVAYNNRLKVVLDEIEAQDPDISMILYVMDKAKQVSIVRSFRSMIGSPGFLKIEDNLEGSEMLLYVQKWLNNFTGLTDDKTYDLKTAFETLIFEGEYLDDNQRIGCGLEVIDGWMDGGLRKKNLAVLLAPTGAGKSATLTIIAHKMASAEGKNVWFISNELPINEVAERFLSRVTGKELTKIMDNPSIAFKGLKRFWDSGLDKRLLLTEINKECTTDDIEADMEKYISLHGWKPDVIVLDYMERMRPNLSEYKRDQSWEFMGAIARDLVRFAKRKNILIWTAGQTNRAGMSATQLLMDHAQGSVKHLQEAAAVLTLQKEGDDGDDDEKKRVNLTFTVQKLRHSANKRQQVTLECDLGRMSISNIKATRTEAFVVEKKTDNETSEVKDEPKNLNYPGKGKAKGRRIVSKLT